MAWDEVCLLKADALPGPLLRFYQWKKASATFGYFQKYEDAIRLSSTPDLTRRMTGGAFVSHFDDWTYSLIFPKSSCWYELRAKESYEKLHKWIADAFENLGFETHLNSISDSSNSDSSSSNSNFSNSNFIKKTLGECFVEAEENDLFFRGRKLAGAAQRRKKCGLLIQGSIQSPPQIARETWQNAFLRSANRLWKIEWKAWNPSSNFSKKAGQIARSKFESDHHIRRR